MLRNKIVALLVVVANFSFITQVEAIKNSVPDTTTAYTKNAPSYINKIYVKGNKIVPTSAIISKIPFRSGDVFRPKKSAEIIRAIHRLGNFRYIQLKKKETKPGLIDLHVIVEEKDRISNIKFEGNTHFDSNKLLEKIEAKTIHALDEYEIRNLEQRIKKAYREKNYHHAQVHGKFETNEEGEVFTVFTIEEGKISRIRRVTFEGNKSIPDGVLRNKIFTREDWVLGFLDRSGMYHPDALLQDKYTLENCYQSNGFLTAQVTDTVVNEEENGSVDVRFKIKEGDIYTLSSVSVPGNDLLSESVLRHNIPLWPGQLYSKERIRKAMEQLRKLWGEYGYIYADVQPSIRPDEDTKTVAITLRSDLGNRIHVNRINIMGNTRTKDTVIRREILFNESEILTTRAMDNSKRRVQLLGYFDQTDGVNWKIKKVDDETADLELLVKEIKTGKINAKVGFGGQPTMQSTSQNFSVGAGVYDINWRGTGLRYSLFGTYAENDKTIDASLSNNWLFNRPITGTAAGYIRKTTYEDFHQTKQSPIEQTAGGSFHAGFRIPKLNFMDASCVLGIEDICYKRENIAEQLIGATPQAQAALQEQVDRRFQAGKNLWIGTTLGQDIRNHPTYPTEGYSWIFDTKLGIPHANNAFGYYRLSLKNDWYTPLIKEHNLILHVHTFFGLMGSINNKSVPYRELFHVGGPATVRGFQYGEIGPMIGSSSLGGTRAFVNNVELQFPISTSHSIRGRFFYDGGASWKTTNPTSLEQHNLLNNNNFEYRHAIGFGISINGPTPIRIDWGFKLDRKKKRGERLSEVHVAMSHEF